MKGDAVCLRGVDSGRLDGGHQHFLASGSVLLRADNLLDLLEHAEAQGQPGIDTGARLADHAGAQHQAVRDNLGLGGVFPDGRQEILGKAHGDSRAGWQGPGDFRQWSRELQSPSVTVSVTV